MICVVISGLTFVWMLSVRFWKSVTFIVSSLEELPLRAELGQSCLATKIGATGPSLLGDSATLWPAGGPPHQPPLSPAGGTSSPPGGTGPTSSRAASPPPPLPRLRPGMPAAASPSALFLLPLFAEFAR